MTTDFALGSEDISEPLLHLEYACTAAERTEAESLSLRHQIGAGSKWLTMLILLAVLGGAGFALWEMVIKTMPPLYRPLAIGAILCLWVFIFVRERRRKQVASAMSTVL